MNADVINSIAAWVGLTGFIPALGATITYGLGKHAIWRKSVLGRIMFMLFLAMTLIYVVFTLQKIIGRHNIDYAVFSLCVFTFLMVAMWAVWFIILHEQLQSKTPDKKPIYKPKKQSK